LPSRGTIGRHTECGPGVQDAVSNSCRSWKSISFSMKQTSPSRFNSRTSCGYRSSCEMIPNLFHNHHPSPITFHIPLPFHCLGQSPNERHSSLSGLNAGSGRSLTAGMGSGPTRSTPPRIRSGWILSRDRNSY